MERENKRVCYESIIINLVLSLGKIVAGIVGHSAAMVSDAVHSASDVFSTIIVLIGLNLAEKPADKEHRYGHERFECLAGILLAFILALTGLDIGASAIKSLRNPENVAMPGILPLIAALISIAVKEFMFRRTRAQARKSGSSALMADAWHHRSDALSSIGSFVGILGARMGLRFLDPAACIVICFFIEKAAWDIFADAANKLTDSSAPAELENSMREVISAVPGVRGIDLLSTRLFGERVYVDVEIRADGKLTLNESHAIADKVHDGIESTFPQVKHCMVHVNPERA